MRKALDLAAKAAWVSWMAGIVIGDDAAAEARRAEVRERHADDYDGWPEQERAKWRDVAACAIAVYEQETGRVRWTPEAQAMFEEWCAREDDSYGFPLKARHADEDEIRDWVDAKGRTTPGGDDVPEGFDHDVRGYLVAGFFSPCTEVWRIEE